MPEHVPFIRIFVSSPGDVNDERKIALDVIEQLPYRPTFREKVAFRVIAWDKPGAGTPMRATLTPQDAINKGLPTPSECDIVIVIFWSRMGTPFIHTDGVEYQSGTHWELINAIEAKRPETVIYRRTDEPPFKVSDADFDQKHAQYKAVQAFFKSELFYAADGKIKRGINMYKTPDDFRRAFEIDLEVLVLDILNRKDADVSTDSHLKDDENVTTIQTLAWDVRQSPFPGLHAFKEEDAPIFFGRGYETDALVKQLNDSRFVAVVGASGSGKSSLVGAGLIPRLRANAIEGSKDWQIIRFIPGENPFERLYDALLDIFPQFKPNPLEARRIKQNFIADLREAPQTLLDICITGLENLPEWAQVLLFVDQFEELFTLANPNDAKSFAVMLDAIAKSARLRVVVTMRADFYHRAVEYPQLAELLRTGSFPLAIPKRDALRQMIERPAERAGLTFDHALVERILNDTGDEPGNLALMAYALDELYKLDDDKTLTHHEYEQLGGVQGAIGTRAENQFMALGMDENVIQQVFHALVEVDERGTATRRREQFQSGSLPDEVRRLIEAFTDARLLTTNYDEINKTATVEVAHEAILRSWPRLTQWIEDTQDDLRLLRQVRNAAHDWQTKERPDYLLWPQERLKLVYAMQARLNPDLNEVEQDFIEPEQKRLLRELETLPHDQTSHERRRDIGDRLAVIGDTRLGVGVKDGIPDLFWLPVEVSPDPVTIKTDKLEIGPIIIPPLFIAQYQITYAQFQTFLDADDGFADARWWDGMPDMYQRQEMAQQRTKISNAPRDSVSWYQCVAFARWLDAKYQELGLFERFLPSPQTPLPTAPSALGEGLQNPALRGPLLGEGLQNMALKGEYRAKASEVLVQIARELRQRETSAEDLLWACLRDRRLADLKFRRQHPVPNTTYVVDFFCYEHRLVVELDGGVHSIQQAADAVRQGDLEAQGLRVLRFPNDMLYTHLEDVLTLITQSALEDSPLLAAQRRSGEGLGVRASDWQIRLPTEWEWQWMAQGGTEARAYPWGKWQEGYANTSAAGLNRTTAVGMYPHGRTECGASDVAGNLFEWCLNDHSNPEIVDGYSNGERKVLRGGSFNLNLYLAAASFRHHSNPNNRNYYYGFRVVVAAPISAL